MQRTFHRRKVFFFLTSVLFAWAVSCESPKNPKQGPRTCASKTCWSWISQHNVPCARVTPTTLAQWHTHTHTHTHTGIIYFSPGLGKFQSQASLETKGCLSYRPNRSALKTLIHPTPNLLLRPGESFPWCWTDLSVEIRLGRNPLRFRASDPSAALHGSSYIMFSSLIVERSTSCCLGSSGMAVINALQSRQGNVIRVAQSFCFWRSRMIL